MVNTVKLRYIAETIGVLSIVASLVFVGYQIQQDRVIARAELGSDSVAMDIAIHEALHNPELSGTYWKMLRNPEDLSEVEILQMNNLLQRITELFFRECYLFARGIFPECKQMIESHAPLFFGNKYAQLWWEKETNFKPFLPSWVDAQIKSIDPSIELNNIEALKSRL